MKKEKSGLYFLICLIGIFISSFLAMQIQTDWGEIQVTSLKIPGKNGSYVSADLYRPKSATSDNKAPMVVVSPGFQRTKETQISNSLELARRGIVTLTVDPYNQGESSSKLDSDKDSALIPAIELVTKSSSFNYIDKNRIGITGHSAGGSATRRAADKYGKLEKKALEEARDPNSEGGTEITKNERKAAESKNKISAIFISGWLRNLNEKSFENIHSNMALGYALYDEGAYRNINRNGDLRYAPESIAFINSGLPDGEKVTEVEIGKAYGNIEDRTMRIAYNEKTLHPIQPYVKEAVAGIIDFFTTTLKVETDLDSMNQTWFYKEIFNLISLTFAFLMLVPLSRILLKTPFFSSLNKEVPAKQTKRTKKESTVFWIMFVVSTFVAFISFIPLAKLTAVLFPEASTKVNTFFFPGRMVNAVMLWAVLNGALGLIMFFLSPKITSEKDNKTKNENIGIRISSKEFFKTLLLALLICTIYFLILQIVYSITHNDYRFLVIASRPLSFKWAAISLIYIPIFFIFYISNSIRVNCSMRIEGDSKLKEYLIPALGNTIGLAAIFVLQYSVFYFTGEVYFKDEWLYVNMLQSVLPMMLLLPFFNKAFFNATGRVWLGPMVTCIIFIIMSLGGSVAYLPVW